MTKTSLTLAAVFCLLGGMVGCVGQKTADDLDDMYRKSQEEIVRLQARIAELETQIELMQQQNQDMTVQYQAMVSERNGLQETIDKLRGDVIALKEKEAGYLATIADLQRSGIDRKLPEGLDNQLKQFAAAHPGLCTYDSTTGMIKFDSDLTFPLGSDDVGSEAKGTLQQLATIFNSTDAQPYEVRVVGHTDTVRIAKESTRKEHPTNWHLSVHRAIAVKDALEAAGVSKLRLNVAGYGPYRPIVQNTRTGARENRRVEIYLTARTPVNEQFLQSVGGEAPKTGTGTPPENPAIYK